MTTTRPPSSPEQYVLIKIREGVEGNREVEIYSTAPLELQLLTTMQDHPYPLHGHSGRQQRNAAHP